MLVHRLVLPLSLSQLLAAASDSFTGRTSLIEEMDSSYSLASSPVTAHKALSRQGSVRELGKKNKSARRDVVVCPCSSFHPCSSLPISAPVCCVCLCARVAIVRHHTRSPTTVIITTRLFASAHAPYQRDCPFAPLPFFT